MTGNTGSFVDHLSELRNRLLVVAAVFLAVAVGAYVIRGQLSTWLVARLESLDIGESARLVYITPAEFFLTQLRVAAVVALVVVIPLFVIQLWAFMRPGLLDHEKQRSRGYVLAGVPLFYGGVAFALFVMLPIVLRFLLSQNTGMVDATISYGSYFGFVFSICLAFGIAFELPVITFLLTSLGILSPATLAKSRGVVVVVLFLVSALLTPPDVVSMLILAGPLLLLFELSLLISRPRHG